MKLKMFSVFDSKAAFFGQVFMEHSEGVAFRSFTDSCNSDDPRNGFALHPEDYSLFYLGEFDNETGEFDSVKPRNMVTASAVRVSPALQPTLDGKKQVLN